MNFPLNTIKHHTHFTGIKLFFLAVFFIFFSCTKEDFLESSDYSLHFSIESIEFDTIFTQTGSITRHFKIYNPHNGTIIIDSIFLATGAKSSYILNVNGMPGKSIPNIRIQSNDSIFVFIQAFLTENNTDTLVSQADSIIVLYNNKQAIIPINAMGQDVIYLSETISENTTLTAGKPYIIKDSLVIPLGITLTLTAGTRMYLHNKANIIVEGSLHIEGDLEKPVLIKSHRIEQAFERIPGQWGSIIFRETSTSNSLVNARISNGVNGILVYGINESPVDIYIHNTIISTMSANCIFAAHASLLVTNSVFINANRYILALQGGSHSFTHVTISNEGTISGRDFLPSVTISDYMLSNNEQTLLFQVKFQNSIIVGRFSNEIELRLDSETDSPTIEFNSCIVKTNLFNQKPDFFTNSFLYTPEEPLFANIYTLDVSLDSLSQAIDKANIDFSVDIPLDIRGNSRIKNNKPDIGAYEFFTKK